MKIYECDQLSDEWFELHRGKVTGSQMGRILTPARRKPSEQQRGLMYELIGQVCSPYPIRDEDGYMSRAMRDGLKREPEARAWYSLECDCEVRRVGFIESDCGRWGISPDGLIEGGGLELKCPTPAVHAEYLIEGVVPLAYLGQVHAGLIVTGFQHWDFVSYCAGLEPFRIRVTPDSFTEALRAELENFWKKYVAALEKVRMK